MLRGEKLTLIEASNRKFQFNYGTEVVVPQRTGPPFPAFSEVSNVEFNSSECYRSCDILFEPEYPFSNKITTN